MLLTLSRLRAVWMMVIVLCLVSVPEAQYVPQSGQPGKDVVWVPTPESTVEKMLDVAGVTKRDFVIDLGSGDGRMVIAAAKRGARALGVEYNPEMVEVSRRRAKEARVSKAEFVQGDMYAADISKATVLALFLLPSNLDRLRDKFLDLKPGTRIVINTFSIPGWTQDDTDTAVGDCGSWCSVLLWIVPAKADGTWRLEGQELVLEQKYQMLSGSLTSGTSKVDVADGRLRGEEISFRIADAAYTGRVRGATMEGSVKSAAGTRKWKATRTAQDQTR